MGQELAGAGDQLNTSQKFSVLYLGFFFMLATRKTTQEITFMKNINNMGVIEILATITHATPIHVFIRDYKYSFQSVYVLPALRGRLKNGPAVKLFHK